MATSTRPEAAVVYAAGAVQGIVLVTFPAASAIFTGPGDYDLTNTQYGALFVPQVIAAITASLLGAVFSRRFGTKGIYLAGLVSALVSMSLLLASTLVMTNTGAAYPLLLLATAFLGAGFGLTVPALNTLTAGLHPSRVDASVLTLNALLGVGTVLAPIFVAIFVGLGFWWGLPATSASLLTGLIIVSRHLPLRPHPQQAPRVAGRSTALPPRLLAYVAFAVLYGVCETVNGNWSQLDMTRELGSSTTVASLALTAFWAMVTVGRVLVAAVRRRLPSRWAYHALPFLLAGSFVLIAELPDEPALGVLAFALAGLGCSALLPLTISFGQEELAAISATTAAVVIAAYQFGYGLAAFGVGPLLDNGVSLPTVYAFAGIVAAAMGAVSFVVAHRRPSPSSLHPAPGPV